MSSPLVDPSSAKHDTNNHSIKLPDSIPEIEALFLVEFQHRIGPHLVWSRQVHESHNSEHPDQVNDESSNHSKKAPIDFKGIEYQVLPSGLGNRTKDVIFFKHGGSLTGIACYISYQESLHPGLAWLPSSGPKPPQMSRMRRRRGSLARGSKMLSIGALIRPAHEDGQGYGAGQFWALISGLEKLCEEYLSTELSGTGNDPINALNEYFESHARGVAKETPSEVRMENNHLLTPGDPDNPFINTLNSVGSSILDSDSGHPHSPHSTPLKPPWLKSCRPFKASNPFSPSNSNPSGSTMPASFVLGSHHPARGLPLLISMIGPLIFKVWQAALVRERLLIIGSGADLNFSRPSPRLGGFLTMGAVERGSSFVYSLAVIGNIPNAVMGSIKSCYSSIPPPKGPLPPFKSIPLYTVGTTNLDHLQKADTYIAFSTDEILYHKPNVYDQVLVIPPNGGPVRFEIAPTTELDSRTKVPHPKEIRANIADANRFSGLLAALDMPDREHLAVISCCNINNANNDFNGVYLEGAPAGVRVDGLAVNGSGNHPVSGVHLNNASSAAAAAAAAAGISRQRHPYHDPWMQLHWVDAAHESYESFDENGIISPSCSGRPALRPDVSPQSVTGNTNNSQLSLGKSPTDNAPAALGDQLNLCKKEGSQELVTNLPPLGELESLGWWRKVCGGLLWWASAGSEWEPVGDSLVRYPLVTDPISQGAAAAAAAADGNLGGSSSYYKRRKRKRRSKRASRLSLMFPNIRGTKMSSRNRLPPLEEASEENSVNDSTDRLLDYSPMLESPVQARPSHDDVPDNARESIDENNDNITENDNLEVFIMAYFHELTTRIMGVLADCVAQHQGAQNRIWSSTRVQGLHLDPYSPARHENQYSPLIPNSSTVVVDVTPNDFHKMGFDYESSSDRLFVSKIIKRWFSRDCRFVISDDSSYDGDSWLCAKSGCCS